LASIGIIVVVLSVTVVAFGPMMKSSGLKTASRILRSAIDGARIRAIQQRRRIRFEATPVPGTVTNQWCVTSSASDPLREWPKLPEFIAVGTNADGGELTSIRTQISITFAPDGSVARVFVNYAEVANPPGVFRISVGNTRNTDVEGGDIFRFIDVIRLTGGTQSLDTLGETY
jgi:hypothetical protein